MNEDKKKKIFKNREELYQGNIAKGYREGIEIEKGAILTEQYVKEHEELFMRYGDLFTAYPDV